MLVCKVFLTAKALVMLDFILFTQNGSSRWKKWSILGVLFNLIKWYLGYFWGYNDKSILLSYYEIQCMDGNSLKTMHFLVEAQYFTIWWKPLQQPVYVTSVCVNMPGFYHFSLCCMYSPDTRVLNVFAYPLILALSFFLNTSAPDNNQR